MKKNIFFQIRLILPFLLGSFFAHAQITPVSELVQITYPIDNSVFQMKSTNTGDVTIYGQILPQSQFSDASFFNNLYLSINKYDYNTKQWGFYKRVQVSSEYPKQGTTDITSHGRAFYASTSSIGIFVPSESPVSPHLQNTGLKELLVCKP